MHRNPKDRNEAIKWARNFIQTTDWFIWDTETTGLGDTDEIIQIAIIEPNGSIVFETLLNPVKRRISSEAKAIHGLDLKKLKDAPTYGDIAPELRDILHGKLVVAYNAKFEFKMLIQTAAKHKPVVDYKFTMKCAMESYSQFVGIWSDYHRNYTWQKLPGATHNAVEDCRATLKIIKEMANAELTEIPKPLWRRLLGL
jgi:DNA polymerase-3 subunit epsilon